MKISDVPAQPLQTPCLEAGRVRSLPNCETRPVEAKFACFVDFEQPHFNTGISKKTGQPNGLPVGPGVKQKHYGDFTRTKGQGRQLACVTIFKLDNEEKTYTKSVKPWSGNPDRK